MLRPQTRRRPIRRGNILIVTLALLSLMAVVGLTAFYFAKDQAENARIRGTPNPDTVFPDDGSNAFNAFLGTLIYDAPDNGAGLLNCLRGHSLARTMYNGQAGSTTPWNGIGTFGYSESVTVNTDPAFPRQLLVNHRLPAIGGPGKIFDPEYSQYRQTTDPPVAGSGAGQQFIPKNAAYTYPDIKDFYLATICPATGEILCPSFHRPNVFGSLDPSNPKWNMGTGVVQTPRPVPFTHPNFPLLPPNADGTYTGDVQNLPGGFGPNYVARNDSIWVDIGLPAFTLPGGRRIKPLVAPLILELDGRLNLNIHGNILNGGAHASGSGIGPHEISMEKAIGAEARNIVALRGTPQRRDGGATSASKAYYPRYPANTQLPAYSAVPWVGFNAANPLQLPGTGVASMFSTAPAYMGGYDSTNAAIASHPTLYNPIEWQTTPGNPRAFPISDNKLMLSQYAPYPSVVGQTAFAGSAPVTLGGLTNPVPNPNPPAQGTGNAYRADPSHPNHQLFTVISNSLDRTGLTPGLGTMQATYGALGGVNLNRSLADYRAPANTGAPLSNGNIGNQVAADTDRIQFANEIFARLVVCVGATGATVAGTGTISVNAGATAAEQANLRQLAQLAVNIVDYIDNDDICTRFVWNGNTGEAVYGVEKPRLVINEAYSEIVNDPGDPVNGAMMAPPAGPAWVRFWVELLNPTNNAYAGGTGPMSAGNGSAILWNGAFNPYRLEIAQFARAGLGAYLSDPANTTGSLDPGNSPEIRFNFNNASAQGRPTVSPNNANYNPAGNPAAGIVLVGPNVTTPKPDEFNPDTTAAPWNNMIVANDPAGGAGATLQNAMAYKMALPGAGATNPVILKRHVILLRRLANPYLPEAATNPFITVDYMDWVPAMDAIHRAGGQGMSRGSNAGNPGGYTAPTSRFSIGKVQPLAGLSVGVPGGATNDPVYTFPNSMVLRQTTPSAGNPSNNFGRHNGAGAAPGASTFAPGPPATLSDTIMAPFDWQPHMDRALINQAELLHATIGKPHLLTQQFLTPGAGGSVNKFSSSAQSALLSNPAFAQIYRAFDLLRVQPFGQQTAHGGRVPGRININTIQDLRVWRALFDAQGFDSFNQAFVDSLWATMMATRTTNMSSRTDAMGTPWSCPVPGASVYDTGVPQASGGGDWPFLPLGAAIVPAVAGANTLPQGTNINDTLLRLNPLTSLPYLTVLSGTHPYQNAEAVRKILNNTTTVSHTFAVWLTVGYFEVTAEVPSGVAGVPNFAYLGKEYYREAPGDTRKKFFAIVDRSNLALEPASNNPATVRPFFSTIEGNVVAGGTSLQISTTAAGTVYSDGYPVTFGPNSQLVVGVGGSQEVVTVLNVAGFADGITTVNLSTPFALPHYTGDCVSNVRPGNPGPQPNFDVMLDMFRPLVPHWARLQ